MYMWYIYIHYGIFWTTNYTMAFFDDILYYVLLLRTYYTMAYFGQHTILWCIIDDILNYVVFLKTYYVLFLTTCYTM